MKYIIVGGVAGGATAAARIRRNTEDAEIILFEKGEYISYANCGSISMCVSGPRLWPSILQRRQWIFVLQTGKPIRRVMINYCFLRVRRLSVLPCRALTMKESSRFAM